MVKKKNILFICKHNIFRSRVGEEFFKKFNKNKKYRVDSAGIIKWNKRDLNTNEGYLAEKNVMKEIGVNFKVKSKSLSSSLLKKTDIVIIVADDVYPSLFKNTAFDGKVIAWKIPDIKSKDKNKEEIAHRTVKLIENKVRKFVKKLK